VYIIALITDVDGTIARRWNATTKFGAVFDPVVDALFMIVAFGSLIALSELAIVPVAAYIVSVLLRAVPSLAHFKTTKTAASTMLSKGIAFCGFSAVVLGTLSTPHWVTSSVLVFGTVANIVLTLSWMRKGLFQIG
jgi:phosphatidylglycerophosphate synthase